MDDLILWICITVFLSVVIIIILVAVKTFKEDKKILTAKAEQAKKDRMMGVLIAGRFKHFNGLPLAEGVYLRCLYCNDKIIFETSAANFNLPLSNLLDVCIKSDVEIEREYISNTGKAIAGGMVFGPIGALIGGKAKEKKTVQVTNYLIFTYNPKNSSDVKYIALQTMDGLSAINPSPAERMVKQFNATPKNKINFDL